MESTQILGFAATGLLVGVVSGMLGIGGAVLVIPLLVLVFGFEQKVAVGTSLAMLLPPIGIFAVAHYYRLGQVNVPAAAIMAALFAGGAWAGSRLAQHVPERPLRAAFCVFLLYVVGNMLFRAERRVWAAAGTAVLAAGYGMAYVVFHALGRRWERAWSPGEVYRRRVARSVAMDYEI